MNPQLLQNLKRLRLSGLLSTLEVRLHEAAGNTLDHAEFLELISSSSTLIVFCRQRTPGLRLVQ